MNATSLNSTAGNGSSVLAVDDSPEGAVVLAIQLYYTPALVVLGSAGNCLSVVVFSTAKLRQLSSSYYLAALAISDTGYLVGILMVWLDLVDVALYNEQGACQAIMYLSSVCSFLSVWFVVAFTVERFVAVKYPLHRPAVCTVARARAVLAVVTLVALVLNLPMLLITGPVYISEYDKVACGMRSEFEELASIFNYVDTVLTFVLPVLAITVLNTSIACTVYYLAKVRRAMTRQQRRQDSNGSDFNSVANKRVSSTRGGVMLVKNGEQMELATHGGNARAIRAQHSANTQAKITKMLLLVSTVFVALNLPSYVCRLWVFIKPPTPGDKWLSHLIVLQHISYVLFNTNFGINFVLYCVSGQNFRRALKTMCCPGAGVHRTGRREVSQSTVSEYQRAAGCSFNSRHRTALNGVWREAHELLPLNISQPQQ
ncbi:neurotensin receptor type 1-like isoform X2 [Neocloeon triangulifer]|uniref:neurotensin receptor type 1-like isoform X2 n=1 Tax=Neocloeon triangulifer TaxID=2078957 RepID=UPI00286F1767|nr:neurotensin receptor type 1-like isoform X2 [Neocloeon triangulifer]